jgi:hypothetical protein
MVNLDNYEVAVRGLSEVELANIYQVGFVAGLWIVEEDVRDNGSFGEVDQVYAACFRVPSEEEQESVQASLGLFADVQFLSVQQEDRSTCPWMVVRAR